MSCDFLAQALPGVQKLSPYVPGKPVDELARELNLDPLQIVKLASNENPLGFSTPPDLGRPLDWIDTVLVHDLPS